MSISKASDILSLRPRDRNNPKVMTAKVKKPSPPNEKYLFLTCEVEDDQDSTKSKTFDLKIFKNSGRLPDFSEVKAGKYLSFSHAKRSPEIYNDGNYNLGKCHLKIELIFEKYSQLHGIFSNLENSTYSDFSKLPSGMAVTIVGESLYDTQFREQWQILSVMDINGHVIEVKYQIAEFLVKSGQKVIMSGDTETDDGIEVLVAKEGRIWA